MPTEDTYQKLGLTVSLIVNDSTVAVAVDSFAAFRAVPLKLSPVGTAANGPGAGRPSGDGRDIGAHTCGNGCSRLGARGPFPLPAD